MAETTNEQQNNIDNDFDKIMELIKPKKDGDDDFDKIMSLLKENNAAFNAANQDGVQDRSRALSQAEIDALVAAIKESLGFSDLQGVKSEIQKLQEEIENLKRENQALKEERKAEKKPDLLEKYRSEIDEAVKTVTAVIDEIFNEHKIEAMAVCIGRVYDSKSASLAYQRSIDSLDEEGFAAACEVLTNPRRIAILKILAKEKLTTSEIGQKAGLVGGQLYHHLSGLEKAGLIKKVDDKYENMPQVLEMLVELYACCGFMNIAKE